MESAPVRAAIYVRLSRNRTGEQSASTKRQEAECRKLAAGRGWEVAAVEIDDDVSAYSGKRRPGYERLLEAMESHAVGAVLAWAPDRLHRSPVELEHFIDVVEATGTAVATVQSGRVELSTPAGRMQARMLGNVARYESEHRSERTRLAHAQIAAEGRWKGGRRPYGYVPDPSTRGALVVVEDEAEVIREVVARVIAGERVGTVVNDLNRREVPTSTGSRWSIPTMRAMLASPTIAGRRASHGEDVGPAQWPAIIDVDTHAELAAVLARSPRRGRVPRVALLSGNRCVCGACGGSMRTGRKSPTVRLYKCSSCWTQVVAEPLEAEVREQLLYRLDRAALPAVGGDERAGDSLEALEDDLAALAESHGAGDITRAEWYAARKPLVQRIDRARADVATRAGTSAVGDLLAPGAARAAWDSLPLDRQQALLDVFVKTVTVAPATKRGRGFDVGRVAVDWRA